MIWIYDDSGALLTTLTTHFVTPQLGARIYTPSGQELEVIACNFKIRQGGDQMDMCLTVKVLTDDPR